VARGPWGGAFEIPRVPSLPSLAIEADNSGVLPSAETATYWEGEVLVTGFTEVRSPLHIGPGTRVRFAPGSSLIARGGIVARVTAEDPIHFEPAMPGSSWGTIALIGAPAEGSEFIHCRFTGGDGAATPFGLLGGTISARNAGKLRIESSRIENGGGDLVSVIYGSLDLRTSHLSRAGRDGLDLSGCPALIDQVEIESVGSNSIEITRSDTAISNSRLAGSRDHGVLARGPHRLVVINSLINGHVIGLHALDGAEVVAYNATFTGNQIPVAASRRTFYHPAVSRITLAKCAVGPAALPFDLRDDSRLTVLDSQILGDWTDRHVSRDLVSGPDPDAATPETLAIHGQVLPGSIWNETDSRIRGYRVVPARSAPPP
jgi:hypothetical protein